jgi:hypothetical protein
MALSAAHLSNRRNVVTEYLLYQEMLVIAVVYAQKIEPSVFFSLPVLIHTSYLIEKRKRSSQIRQRKVTEEKNTIPSTAQKRGKVLSNNIRVN